MSEQEWQAYRTTQEGVGGSEVASILDINPYKAKFILWLEKTGQKERPEIDNEYVEWGNALEPLIRKKFAEKTGFKVFKNNYVLQHSEHPFMLANIDGECLDPSREGRGVLEIKTTAEWNKKEWEGEKVPLAYMAQMQHYLAVTGYNYGYFAVLIGGNKYKQFLVERNENIINSLIEKEKEFIEAVNKVEYPWEIGGSAQESSWLNERYPSAIDEEMSIPQAIEEMALEYNEIQEQMKELKAKAEEIKNQIKLEAKEIKTLKGNMVKINMPTISKTLFDSKKFAQDHSELYEKYKTKTSTYRDFKVKLLEA
jgi:putative phage-type endonuclease